MKDDLIELLTISSPGSTCTASCCAEKRKYSGSLVWQTLTYLKWEQQSMAASFTDNPIWVKKMKDRFAALDVDKNGTINDDDVALLAKNLAKIYIGRKEKMLKSITLTRWSLSGPMELEKEHAV